MRILYAFLCCISGIGCMVESSLENASAQTFTSYEAEIAVTTLGQTNHAHIIKDGFRFKFHNASASSISNEYSQETVYDGNLQGIVWDFYKKQRLARPGLSSIISRVQFLMKERGKDSTLKKYNIPKVAFSLFNSSPLVNGIPPPPMDILTSKSLIGLAMKSIGKEKVGEYLCEVMSFDGMVRGQRIRKKVWLHKKSGLILRQEDKCKMEGSAPELSTVVSISHLKFLKSTPKSAFELPTGTTVELPETFDDVKLDDEARFIRKKTEGDAKLIGIDFMHQLNAKTAN